MKGGEETGAGQSEACFAAGEPPRRDAGHPQAADDGDAGEEHDDRLQLPVAQPLELHGQCDREQDHDRGDG
jgi:hypothetical protein